MKKSTTPHIWADRLRNLATVLVICIHVSAPIAQGYADMNTSWWWWGNFWDSMSRPAVPLFVMLSGFLLLGKDYPLPDFLKRRFTRVIVPALFWMTVYSIYNYKSHGHPADFPEFIKGLVQGPVHYHLWFIYLIIGLYLTYPVLRPWVRSAREQDFLYFFFLCILGTWVWKSMHTFFNVDLGLYIELFCNNVGYFVLGYYLGHKVFPGEEPRHEGLTPWRFTRQQGIWWSAGFIIVGTAITMVGVYWASQTYSGGAFHPFFHDYLAPNVTVMAFGWFLFAQLMFNKSPLLPLEQAFSEASFGVYFAHVLILDWWSAGGYWHSRCHPWLGVPMLTAMATGMVFLFVATIRALPFGKKDNLI